MVSCQWDQTGHPAKAPWDTSLKAIWNLVSSCYFTPSLSLPLDISSNPATHSIIQLQNNTEVQPVQSFSLIMIKTQLATTLKNSLYRKTGRLLVIVVGVSHIILGTDKDKLTGPFQKNFGWKTILDLTRQAVLCLVVEVKEVLCDGQDWKKWEQILSWSSPCWLLFSFLLNLPKSGRLA